MVALAFIKSKQSEAVTSKDGVASVDLLKVALKLKNAGVLESTKAMKFYSPQKDRDGRINYVLRKMR